MEEIRVKLPEGEEVFGIVEQMLGCRKMYVKCSDGIRRLCRVPGRYARRIWVKPGDVVIVKPWEIQKDRGDVIFKYTAAQIDWLKRKGYLKFEEI